MGRRLTEADYSSLAMVSSGMLQGDYQPSDQPVTILREGLGEYPQSLTLRIELLRYLDDHGEHEEATAVYEEAKKRYLQQLAVPRDTPLDFLNMDAGVMFRHLLRNGNVQECRNLESRIRDVVTHESLDLLVYMRAIAEFQSAMYEAAIKSFEECLQTGQGNEKLIVHRLVVCHLALNRGHDGVSWIRRSLELNGDTDGFLSILLRIILEAEGPEALEAEIKRWTHLKEQKNPRTCATISCYEAWLAARRGDRVEALRSITKAGPYTYLSDVPGPPTEYEVLTWGVLMHGIYSTLSDEEHKAVAQDMLKGFPDERIEEFRKLFNFETLAATPIERAGAASERK